MKIAIMQPNFIPWRGFFELAKSVDKFVFLDNVQFSKNSWHNRNRLLLKDGSVFTWTLPLENHKLTCDFRMINVNKQAIKIKKIENLFQQNFSKSKNYFVLEKILGVIKNTEFTTLAEINTQILTIIFKHFNILTKVYNGSEMGLKSYDRTERILEICYLLGGKEYITTVGAANYLSEDRFEERFGGRLTFMDYTCEYSYEKTGVRGMNLSALSFVLDEKNEHK